MFSLFRRSSSLASHPTTHGVSLRGIGASGASRTLVLVDGVPENDGFGNWVHWSALPLLQIERVELTGSGLSTLYGSSALAGAISVVTRHPPGDALDVRASAGSLETGEVEGYGGRENGGGWRSGRSRLWSRFTAGAARAGIARRIRSDPASSPPTIPSRSSSVASRCPASLASAARAAMPGRA